MRENWDIPRLLAWYEYLDRHPPIQAMVQGYLGVKPLKKSDAPSSDGEKLVAELVNLAALRPGLVVQKAG